jgi:hypothetical protein
MVIIEENHYPIPRPSQLMGSSRVREQGCKMPASSLGMEYGHPGLSLRIETAGRDSGKLAFLGLFSIFGINVKQQF